MGETQLASEIVKLITQSKQNSILSDLVKVGIPSIVAIASGIVTYKISADNSKISIKLSELTQQHNEKLAQLSIEHEKAKIINERRSNLILEVSNGLTNIIDEYEKYLNFISTKKHVESRNEEVSEHLEQKVIAKYNSSADASDNYFNKIYSMALMLGNESIVSSLNELRNHLIKIHSECSYDCDLPFESISPYNVKLQSIRKVLFDSLSNEFNSI